MLTLEMARANQSGSTPVTRLKRRDSRESHEVVLDVGERTLMKSVERGEWTPVARVRAEKACHARLAKTTVRRLRKA